MSETGRQRQSLRTRLLSGAAWSIATALVTQGSALVGALIAARILGRGGYGELGVINGTVATLGTFAGMGLSTTALRYVAELRATDRVRAGRILSLTHRLAFAAGGLIAVALVIAGPFVARSLLNAPNLGLQVQLSAVLVLFGTVNGVQTGALSGFEAFAALTRISFVRAAISIAGVLAGALSAGLTGIVVANSLVAVFSYFVNAAALRKASEAAGVVLAAPTKADLIVLRAVAAPALLASVFTGPIGWIGTALLVNEAGGYAEMGLFNAATQWRMFILFVPVAVAPALLPAMAELHGRGESARFRRVLAFNLLTTVGAATAAAVPVMVLSRTIMSMYGKSFIEGGPTLIALAISAVFQAASATAGNALSTWNKYWHGLWLNVGWGAVFVGLAAMWVSRGAIGVAWAYAVSYGVHTVVSALYVMSSIRTNRRLEEAGAESV